MSSSLMLMIVYVLVAFAFQFVAFGVSVLLASVIPSWSMPIFLGLYFLMFWLAWPVAIRLTAPKGGEEAKAA